MAAETDNNAELQQNSDATAMEEFLQKPSTLPAIGIDLVGYRTEEFARSVGKEVETWLCLLGKILNLKRLKQVVVSYDYEQSLAQVDQGTPVSGPLKATNDEIAVGIAMTPTVVREGEVFSVMVLNADCMAVLAMAETPENAPLREQMIYTLAHESAHVHDLNLRAMCLPDTILKKPLSFRDGVLFRIASGCWDEYIACRLSAFFSGEAALRLLEETFCAALIGARERANAEIRQFRMHADVRSVTSLVSDIYRRVLVYAAYLLGHIDGIEGDDSALIPNAINALQQEPYFEPFFSRLRDELRAMYSTSGEWNSLDVYEPLKQLADELLKLGGIDIQPRPNDGAYVHIPFSSETMPTREERVAFMAGKHQGEQE